MDAQDQALFVEAQRREAALTDRQRRVIGLILEGYSNTEIGEALGISLDGAKWNVSEILSKLGLDTREQVAEFWRWRGRGFGRLLHSLAGLLSGSAKLKVGGAAFAAAGVGVAAFAVWHASRVETAAVARAPQLEVPGVVMIDGQPMLDAGPIFESVDGSALHLVVSERQDLVVVEAAVALRLVDSGGRLGWTVVYGGVDSAGLTASLRGTDLAMQIEAGSLDTHAQIGAGTTRTFVSDVAGRGPTLVVKVGGHDPHRRFHAVIESGGHLFVAAAPTPLETVLSEWTGERLDVSGAVKVGQLIESRDGSQPFGAADCDEHRCQVMWTGSYLAPREGDLTCSADGRLEFFDGGVRLHFRDLSQRSGSQFRSCKAPAGQHLQTGDEIAAFSFYEITASSIGGEVMPLVASLDGMLYAGSIRQTVGCPCMYGK